LARTTKEEEDIEEVNGGGYIILKASGMAIL